MRKLCVILAMLPMLLCGGAEGSDKVVDGLLKLGQGVLEHEINKREAKEAARAKKEAEKTPPQTAAAEEAADKKKKGKDKKRTWKDRTWDMLGTFGATAADEFGDKSLSEVLAFSLKDSLDVLIDEYKEEYKDEGREYAKELGDKLVERVREDPKIRDSITALQALCWSVIGYLSLVTLIVFFSLISITRGNRRLRKQFDALQHKFDALMEELKKK
ncbi:MAG: hypothetical protein IJA63_01455 [Akkermansia sp.]|nr:hypothetical protein [Akkermansia sp.]